MVYVGQYYFKKIILKKNFYILESFNLIDKKMEIDQDIGIENVNPHKKNSLNTITKKPLPKKPIFIILGIIITIIIIVSVIMFILPNLNFTPVIDDTNTDPPVESIELTCEKRLNLNLGGVVAIFAEGETKNTLISGKGVKSPYIQFYANKVFIESIPNPYLNMNNGEDEIVNLLKEKNVSFVALAGAGQELIKQFGEIDLKCYFVGGSIASHVGYDPPPIDTSFCQKLIDQNIIGKTAFGANNKNQNALISGKGAKSPFLIIYQNLNYLDSIENTAINSVNFQDELIILIQSEKIENIIMADFGEEFENKLNDSNITCYEAGGEIQSII